MSISANKVLEFFIKKTDRKDIIGDLVREILVLDEKIQNTGDQSFYFRKGLSSHRERLDKMKTAYEKYRLLLDGCTSAGLASRLEDAERDRRIFENKFRNSPGIINLISWSAYKSDAAELRNLSDAKARYNSLKPIDEYLRHKEELIIFFD